MRCRRVLFQFEHEGFDDAGDLGFFQADNRSAGWGDVAMLP